MGEQRKLIKLSAAKNLKSAAKNSNDAMLRVIYGPEAHKNQSEATRRDAQKVQVLTDIR